MPNAAGPCGECRAYRLRPRGTLVTIGSPLGPTGKTLFTVLGRGQLGAEHILLLEEALAATGQGRRPLGIAGRREGRPGKRSLASWRGRAGRPARPAARDRPGRRHSLRPAKGAQDQTCVAHRFSSPASPGFQHLDRDRSTPSPARGREAHAGWATGPRRWPCRPPPSSALPLRSPVRVRSSTSDRGFDRFDDGRGGLPFAEMIQHHRRGPDLPDGIRDPLAGDIGRGAVNRFEQ